MSDILCADLEVIINSIRIGINFNVTISAIHLFTNYVMGIYKLYIYMNILFIYKEGATNFLTVSFEIQNLLVRTCRNKEQVMHVNLKLPLIGSYLQ